MVSFFKFKVKNNGFTVIELLVVISIIVAFFLVAVPNFYKIKLQLSLSRVAYKFSQDVRRAQNMALTKSRYYDPSTKVEQSVDGYGIDVDLSALGSKKYIMYADKSPGNQQYDSLDYIVETIDFSSADPGIIIKEVDNVIGKSASINFNSSDLNTNIFQLLSLQNSATVVFALESDPAITKSVLVNTSGLVEVK